MTYEEAMRLLARVREGIYYPVELVSEALAMTGDRDYDYQVPPADMIDFVQNLRRAGQL